ncbi:hypothetical protein ASPZODRAFT_140031 [Penicilliopsis zonata CBS 506.65]|uniref:BHLH domain-containing protein n=1 Tax=Penicilliopsis zonata CBS 506.65 TaxID=1073090 RepID=A0A1L9SP97_9EURO|nr:hypothetical protein ASPZODRAFT_140031 [Penicilliopsis zonata CBS 506.65]OJJ49089.1 hypothetical protein ASPZODRAFT_140031 [Penicilliopsis zonata CBS 506.65]
MSTNEGVGPESVDWPTGYIFSESHPPPFRRGVSEPLSDFSCDLDDPDVWSLLDVTGVPEQVVDPSLSCLVPRQEGDRKGSGSDRSPRSLGPEVAPVRRRAAYRFERRYRVLNDQIRLLDGILPREKKEKEKDEEEEQLQQEYGSRVQRRTKDRVLARAIEHILFLQRRVAIQEREICALRNTLKNEAGGDRSYTR